MPIVAGLVSRVAATMHTLNATRPVPASAASSAHSRAAGRRAGPPRSRATASRITAATVYRTAWPPKTG